MKLIIVQGSSIGCTLSSRIEIIAIGFNFHTEISREREPTFARGAAGAYGQHHTMHHHLAGSSWEKKHEVCKLIAPSILIR